MIVRTGLRFVNGRPVGADAVPDYTKWDEKVANRPSLHDIFDRASLNCAFPLATTIRAGVVLVACEGAKRSVLLVHEQVRVCNSGGRVFTLPENRGVPKGAMEAEDISALATAARELREETGIDLATATLSRTTIHCYRGEVAELIVWFIATVPERPAVTIRADELSGYSWWDINDLPAVAPVTRPSQALFHGLSQIDFWEQG